MTAEKIYTSDGRIDITDILFEHRNKAYGAYELRKHYDERMNKSMLITLGIFVLLFLLSMIFVSNKGQVINLRGASGKPDITTKNVNLPITKSQTQMRAAAPKASTPKPDPNIADFKLVKKDFIPLLKPDSIKIPANDNLKTSGPAVAANLPGMPDNNGPNNTTGSNGTAPTQPTTPQTVKNAQFMPQFPGGQDGLEQYLQNNIKFTDQALNNRAEGKILIDFIIDIDGTVTNVKVAHDYMGYGCEQNAIDVIKGMPTWTPGSDNGHLVRVEMTLPITYKTF